MVNGAGTGPLGLGDGDADSISKHHYRSCYQTTYQFLVKHVKTTWMLVSQSASTQVLLQQLLVNNQLQQENRQAFLTFGDKSWGSIKLGKDLGIYASDAILNDMTLLGVGSALVHWLAIQQL